MMEAENLKDMELESMIEKLQEVLVESISVAARLWDVEMVLRVGGEDDGRKREGVTRPEGGEGTARKIFSITKNHIPGVKNCQEQYLSGLGG